MTAFYGRTAGGGAAFAQNREAYTYIADTPISPVAMLETTSEDIAGLNDEQLREVVARLCEAELLRHGHSPAYVTWGGHQKASDGGIDVRVALPTGASIDGFVPRPATGYQVKQEDLPARQISKEMLPKGVIRPAITALAVAGGGYVIVSSQGSTADRALTARRKAMRKAIQGIAHADGLFVDFYDRRTRVATWVRSHACLIPWVRTLAGRGLRGWQSYGSWRYWFCLRRALNTPPPRSSPWFSFGRS